MIRSTRWYQVINRGDAQPVEILIYDEIGGFGISAADLINQINAAKDQPILARINSPGGSVFEGYAIYNAFQKHGNVEVQIDGLAASIASYIAMAGTKVRMAENALMMIHNPECIVGGDSEEMRKAMEMLDRCKDSIVSAYAAKTKMDGKALSKLMDAETWMSAPEAKEMGFVDEITAPLKAAASFDTKKFRNAPTNQNPMKILTKALAALIATNTGATITEDSTEADVQTALGILVKAKTDLVEATNKVTTLTTEKVSLEQQFIEATNLATKAQGDLTEANTKVTNLTTELGTVKAERDTAKTNVTRLETLCKLKGIKPTDAIPNLDEPTEAVPLAQLEAEMQAAKTPDERLKVLNKFKDLGAKNLIIS